MEDKWFSSIMVSVFSKTYKLSQGDWGDKKMESEICCMEQSWDDKGKIKLMLLDDNSSVEGPAEAWDHEFIIVYIYSVLNFFFVILKYMLGT